MTYANNSQNPDNSVRASYCDTLHERTEAAYRRVLPLVHILLGEYLSNYQYFLNLPVL
ncbi:hypothetical protein [Nostoc sp. C110]|uniref:hypothetical protein n=1 Tax=Nostoc sp. C110 TaxID=3349876 RepID=UPI00370D3F2E